MLYISRINLSLFISFSFSVSPFLDSSLFRSFSHFLFSLPLSIFRSISLPLPLPLSFSLSLFLSTSSFFSHSLYHFLSPFPYLSHSTPLTPSLSPTLSYSLSFSLFLSPSLLFLSCTEQWLQKQPVVLRSDHFTLQFVSIKKN